MSTYSLYHGDDPHTTTDDPKVVIAHAKARGHRLSMPSARSLSRMPSLPRVTLPNLKDQPAETVYQALAKSIAKHEDMDGSCARVVGNADDNGYWLAATDGHRALMRAGNGTKRERFPATPACQFTPGPVQFVLNRPFADVWRRMSVCASGWIDLELTTSTLTLSTRDEDGDTATEVCPHVYACSSLVDEPVHFRLNPTYLAPLLRFWPITVAYRPPVEDDNSPLLFSPAGVAWRYILMPIKLRWHHS